MILKLYIMDNQIPLSMLLKKIIIGLDIHKILKIMLIIVISVMRIKLKRVKSQGKDNKKWYHQINSTTHSMLT